MKQRCTTLFLTAAALSLAPGRSARADDADVFAAALPDWNYHSPRTTSAEESAEEEAAAVSTDTSAGEQAGSASGQGKFAFGSFGRVHAAADGRGHTGRSSNIVAFGSRTDLPDYAELELRREDEVDGLQITIDATVAFFGEFFHFDAQTTENIAVRNLYADVENAFLPGLGFWAGSRMVRGDDIYLLNVWLLDNLNLVGGGTRYRSENLELMLEGGLARPSNPFYQQTINVVPAFGVTPAKVDLLDRPRTVIAAKASYFPQGKGARGLKLLGYGEGHYLPRGERQREDDQTETLPSDRGLVAGVQAGGWLDKPNGFLNVFLRVATGIAVYDPLSTPMQLGTAVSAKDAREWRVGFSQNLESGDLGLQLGGYMRGVYDAVDDTYGKARLLEGAVAARPYLWFAKYAGLSVDASYQALARSVIDDRTGKQVEGGVTKLAAIPFLSPYGRGTYTRPHIHLIYQVSFRDAGARALYAEQDRRSSLSTEHYIAVGAEWWFNSTSY